MKIEIWSDIACPFCYIGGRHLELALDDLPFGDEVELEWRSFQLDPTAPVETQESTAAMLARKYGMSVEQARASQQQISERAAAVGLSMNPEGSIPTNTKDAHRLMHLAARHGLAHAMGQRLFKAHFEDRVNVGKHGELKRLGVEVGLPAAEIDALLAGNEFEAEVSADQQLAASFGVRGVPFFVLDRKYAISGAQPVESFRAALKKAWDERSAHA